MAQGSFLKVNGKRLLVSLAVLTLVGAGVYGTLAYETDFEPYLPDALPEASSFELLHSVQAENKHLYVGNSAGSPVGYVTAAEAQGRNGPMMIMVGWSLDGTILTLEVPLQYETKAWYSKLFDKEFFAQFPGRQYSQPLTLDEDIDVVSGATVSCVAVTVGLQLGRELLAEHLGDPYPQPEETVNFGIGEIMLLVGLGMVVMFRTVPPLRKRHWMRYLTLVFGLFVFGIWLSNPLSLTDFAIFTVGFGPSWQSHLFLYILVVSLVALALVLAKNFWCFWLCPFAAIQEGAHFVGGGRVRPITKRQLLLRNTRYFILWLVLLFVLLGRNPALSVFEPWATIFSLKGSLVEWLLVVVVVGVAMFIYDFWCHYLCPVGATMDIVLRVRMWFVDGFRRLFAR